MSEQSEQTYPKLHTKKIIIITAVILNLLFGNAIKSGTFNGQPVTITIFLSLMLIVNIICVLPISFIILIYCKEKNRARERMASKVENSQHNRNNGLHPLKITLVTLLILNFLLGVFLSNGNLDDHPLTPSELVMLMGVINLFLILPICIIVFLCCFFHEKDLRNQSRKAIVSDSRSTKSSKKNVIITLIVMNCLFGILTATGHTDGHGVTPLEWLQIMLLINIVCIISICGIVFLRCNLHHKRIKKDTESLESSINSTAQKSIPSNNAIKAVSENIDIQEPLPSSSSEKEQISISLTPIVDAEPQIESPTSVNSAHQELLKKYAIITPLDTTDFTYFDFFVEAGRLSIEHFSDPDKIKLLQRHLGIGFNRASRLCDQLVYYKVLSSKGSHYDVIMDLDSFYTLVTTFHGQLPEKQFRPVTTSTSENVITPIDTTDFTDFDFFLHAGIVSITDPDHDKLRLIQRHLGIGFSHAARLCDILYYYKVLKSYMEKQCGYSYYNVIMDLDSFLKLTGSFHGHMPEESTSKELDYMMNDHIPSSKRGQHFETQCAELLKKNGFINVIVTKKSGDHGADVLAEKDGISYAIQCKYYSSAVGNSAVQEAFSAKAFYGKDIAVVMTNSYFTRPAQEEAAKIHVKLWDKDTLRSLLKSSHSNDDSLSAKEKLNQEVDSYRADLELEARQESSASDMPNAKEA